MASSQRLILWDIDETMISSGGSGGRALGRALNTVYDVPLEKSRVNMSGKTDPQIIAEILISCGHDEKDARLAHERVIPTYLQYLDEEIAASPRLIIHQGVKQLLWELSDNDDAYLGLVTGNVKIGAGKKLTRFALAHYFEVGAYGCDSANRLELPAIAVERAEKHFERSFTPEQVVVIGDSIYDVACGHGFGAKVIAVSSGHTSFEELEACKPKHLFRNLGDTQAVLAAIFD